MKISKKKSTEKVDGTVALVMGLVRAMLQKPNPDSVYDSRGILFI